ncbi:MAG: PqqD family protein [Longimicrobiaceae bacterium]
MYERVPGVNRPATPRPAARPGLVLRKAGAEWLLFDAGGERLHVLNLSAALVWSHCTGELTPAEIAREVESAFASAPPGQLPREVDKVLADFRERGLLMDDDTVS